MTNLASHILRPSHQTPGSKVNIPATPDRRDPSLPLGLTHKKALGKLIRKRDLEIKERMKGQGKEAKNKERWRWNHRTKDPGDSFRMVEGVGAVSERRILWPWGRIMEGMGDGAGWDGGAEGDGGVEGDVEMGETGVGGGDEGGVDEGGADEGGADEGGADEGFRRTAADGEGRQDLPTTTDDNSNGQIFRNHRLDKPQSEREKYLQEQQARFAKQGRGLTVVAPEYDFTKLANDNTREKREQLSRWREGRARESGKAEEAARGAPEHGVEDGNTVEPFATNHDTAKPLDEQNHPYEEGERERLNQLDGSANIALGTNHELAKLINKGNDLFEKGERERLQHLQNQEARQLHNSDRATRVKDQDDRHEERERQRLECLRNMDTGPAINYDTAKQANERSDRSKKRERKRLEDLQDQEALRAEQAARPTAETTADPGPDAMEAEGNGTRISNREMAKRRIAEENRLEKKQRDREKRLRKRETRRANRAAKAAAEAITEPAVDVKEVEPNVISRGALIHGSKRKAEIADKVAHGWAVDTIGRENQVDKKKAKHWSGWNTEGMRNKEAARTVARMEKAYGVSWDSDEMAGLEAEGDEDDLADSDHRIGGGGALVGRDANGDGRWMWSVNEDAFHSEGDGKKERIVQRNRAAWTAVAAMRNRAAGHSNGAHDTSGTEEAARAANGNDDAGLGAGGGPIDVEDYDAGEGGDYHVKEGHNASHGSEIKWNAINGPRHDQHYSEEEQNDQATRTALRAVAAMRNKGAEGSVGAEGASKMETTATMDFA